MVDKSKPSYEDDEQITYSLDVIRSKVPPNILRQNDVELKLLDLGMCNACASNAAAFYVKMPNSRCAKLVRQALEGSPTAVKTLIDTPEYCTASSFDRRSSAAVPVMIAPYLNQSYDEHGNMLPESNCSSTGTVKVDDFLALKTGPGVDFPRIAKLPNLQFLIICSGQHGPKGWIAVIVEDGRGIAGCFPGNSDVRAGPYAGPCKAGWVSEKYVGNLSD
jgi:hypothetical protein